MKFKQYLVEKNDKLLKKYNIKSKDIEIAKKALSKKYKIPVDELEFVFVWEAGKNIVLLSFNASNKSTLSYKWLPEKGV